MLFFWDVMRGFFYSNRFGGTRIDSLILKLSSRGLPANTQPFYRCIMCPDTSAGVVLAFRWDLTYFREPY